MNGTRFSKLPPPVVKSRNGRFPALGICGEPSSKTHCLVNLPADWRDSRGALKHFLIDQLGVFDVIDDERFHCHLLRHEPES
jgi:hypothetical protein